MSGWPHPDFNLRIVDAEDGTPVLTIKFREGESTTTDINHLTGEVYEVPLEVIG